MKFRCLDTMVSLDGTVEYFTKGSIYHTADIESRFINAQVIVSNRGSWWHITKNEETRKYFLTLDLDMVDMFEEVE